MEPRRQGREVRSSRVRLCTRANQQIRDWGHFDRRCVVRRARRRDGGAASYVALFLSELDTEKLCFVHGKVWMSHGDQLSEPPPGFHVIGHTKSAPFAAIAHNTKPFYGIQFHPEVTHSPRGKEVISRFVLNVCGCKTDWTMVRYVTHAANLFTITRSLTCSNIAHTRKSL